MYPFLYSYMHPYIHVSLHIYMHPDLHMSLHTLTHVLRAVPEIILRGGPHFFSDPSTPRTHMGSEPPTPQDT